MPLPDPEELKPFDQSAVTHGLIKKILSNRSSKFAPCDDGTSYHHLKKKSSIHLFLATLFFKNTTGRLESF